MSYKHISLGRSVSARTAATTESIEICKISAVAHPWWLAMRPMKYPCGRMVSGVRVLPGCRRSEFRGVFVLASRAIWDGVSRERVRVHHERGPFRSRGFHVSRRRRSASLSNTGNSGCCHGPCLRSGNSIVAVRGRDEGAGSSRLK